MIGISRTSGATLSGKSTDFDATNIMSKRKAISDDESTEQASHRHSHRGDGDKLKSSPKKRRVSRRLQNVKKEAKENQKIIKEEPAPLQQPPTGDSDSDDSMDDEGISSYEKMRLKNIQDNAKFFASLEIFKAKEDLSIASGTQKKTPSRRGLKKEKKPKEVLPRRPRSLRIQRINPEGTALPPLPEIVDPEPRHERKPSEPIEMIPINIPESKENSSKEFLTLMRDVVKSPKGSSSSKTSSTDLTTFCKTFNKMRIRSERVAKVTKDRIFSVAIHPSDRKVLACAGDKWGKIGIWDVEAVDHSEDGVYLFEPHSRLVNCLNFAPANPGKIYLASYDGTVRCGDIEKGVFEEVYATEDDSITASCFDFLTPDGSQLLVGENQGLGYVAVVDTRKRSNSTKVYEVHDRWMKTISVHPVKKNYFITASSDSTVALWDLRNMKEKGRSKPVVSLPHFKGVTAAYFSPVTGSKILTTSLDDQIRIFKCAEKGAALTGAEVYTTMSHNNHVGRWLTGFRAAWHPTREDVFVSGSMARPRRIEIFDDHCHSLHHFMDEEWLGSVCSLNAFHPTRDILVGGNSSGRLHVFM